MLEGPLKGEGGSIDCASWIATYSASMHDDLPLAASSKDYA